MRRVLFFACAGVLALLLLGARHANAADFVYVATQNGTVRQYARRSDGTLAPLSPPVVRVAPPQNSVTLVIHPTRPLAYAAAVDKSQAILTPCRVQKNGTLAPLKAQAVRVKSQVRRLLMDAKGRFLFAVGADGSIFTFSCSPNGGLKTLPTNHVRGTFGIGEMTGAINRGSLSLDPTGRFAYHFYLTGFSDHSERYLTVYRILPSGAFQKIGGEIRDTSGDETHLSDAKLGEVGFDAAKKWAFVNAFYTRAVALLRVTDTGSLKVVHQQTIQDKKVLTEKDADGKQVKIFKDRVFDHLRLLDTRHSKAALTGQQNELAFARVTPTGEITIYGSVFVYDVRDDTPMLWNRDARFLTTVSFVPTGSDAQGRKKVSPSLVTVRVGDAAHPPKITQTLSLGGDFVETIVSYSAR